MSTKISPTQDGQSSVLLSFASLLRHSMVVLVPLSGTLIAIWLWLEGILVPGPIEFGLFFLFYILNILGMELALHRYFAHKAFKTGHVLRKILAILGSLAYMGPCIWWVAIHRIHHSKCDTKDDPHSPQLAGPGLSGTLKGLYHGHVGWLFTPSSARPENWGRYARDLYKEPALLKIHLAYDLWLLLGLLIPAILGGLLHWSFEGVLLGFLWGGTVRAFCATNAIWAVNSLAHSVGGSQPFNNERAQSSRNNFILAILTLGAGWHNNHHAFPGSAKTSLEWWQIDLTGMLISLMEKMNLVWDVRYPDSETIELKKNN